MKTLQLIDIENVKNANIVLKNLLDRPRSEIVGLSLLYGRAGVGKTRWATKTAIENDYIYHRLETNITLMNFMRDLLSKLMHRTMSEPVIKRTKNGIYNQILDILQEDQNIVILLDEVEYAFTNKVILSTIRDWIDQSLATIVLIGMEQAKAKLLTMNSHYFDRCLSFYEFKPLSLKDSSLVMNEICEIKLDEDIIKYVHNKCNGTLRHITKYIDVLERIARRMKKQELTYAEIKDIISKLEV